MAHLTNEERKAVRDAEFSYGYTVQITTRNGDLHEYIAVNFEHACEIQTAWLGGDDTKETEVFLIAADGSLLKTIGRFITFTIRPGKAAPCELVNSRDEVIAEGTHNHCAKILNAIRPND